MKFLCPSCKAKYQIADEKVAGRSVRMKCRKCGHVIQVSSVAGVGDAIMGSEPPSAIDAVSDASAAQIEAPNTVPPKSEPQAAAPKSEPKPAPPAPEVKKPAPAPVPARPAVSRPTAPGASAAVSKAPLPAPKAPPARSLPQKPSVPQKPSAPTASPSAVAPVAAPAAPLALKSEKKTIQGGVSAPGARPLAAPATIAKPVAAVATSLSDFDPEDESTRIADASALAGAFSLAVGGASEASAPDALSMPADEWFVGINGVPVGPIRLSELRSKAASGSVTRESLVWRDGFEDWRPLKTYPELVAIVDESVSSARASLTPFTPPVASASAPVATAALADPFAGIPAVAPGGGTAPAGAKAVDPFVAGTASAVTGAAVVTDDLEAAVVPRRGTSPVVWIAMAIAILFGLTLGFVFFGKQKPPEVQIRYVDRPVQGTPSAAAQNDKPATPDENTTSADPKNPGKRVASTGAAKPATSAAEPDKGLSTLKGLQGLNTLGPSRGPDTGGPSGTPAGGGQLDSGQIQKTVANYTGSVKRACWQPALDTRDKDAPTTARVTVAITVAPSGSVTNASVGGDPKGYRGLAQCISSRVRGWSFPPSGDTTTVNVPFVFAAQ